MSVPFNAVSAAYNNASRLIQDPAKGSANGLGQGAQGADFGKLLTDQLQGVMDAGKKSDQLSLDMINGKANVVDVVTAIKTRLPDVPLAAYHTSGETMMVRHGAAAGLFPWREGLLENLYAIKRAGADFIITYNAVEAAAFLGEGT